MAKSLPTASERILRARIAAHERWAHEPDRTAATQPARNAAMLRFEREVDPDGTLPPDERAKRAEHARKSYFLKLSLKSARSRRRSRELAEDALAADVELDALGGDAS